MSGIVRIIFVIFFIFDFILGCGEERIKGLFISLEIYFRYSLNVIIFINNDIFFIFDFGCV